MGPSRAPTQPRPAPVVDHDRANDIGTAAEFQLLQIQHDGQISSHSQNVSSGSAKNISLYMNF